MSKIKDWTKIGTPRILAENHGKRLIDQAFQNPSDGKVIDFTIFDSSRISVIIFPMTTHNEVIAVRQFRPAIEQVTLELPGGNIDPGDRNIIEAAHRELLEETGFRAKLITKLPLKLWLDPGSCAPYIYPLLAFKCEKTDQPKKDTNEDIVTELIPCKCWIDMISRGEITDMKSLAVTLLAKSFRF